MIAETVGTMEGRNPASLQRQPWDDTPIPVTVTSPTTAPFAERVPALTEISRD